MQREECIRQYKDKIMSELSQDDEIIDALGLNPDESPDDLVWVRYYPHYYIPQTEDTVKTYVCLEINIPERRVRNGTSDSEIWVRPIIVFDVLTHQEDMHMKKSGESGTRMDYIAELIANKYDGRLDFGVGKLKLKSSIAGSINNTYRVRELIFEAVDVTGVCE